VGRGGKASKGLELLQRQNRIKTPQRGNKVIASPNTAAVILE
jgi:hypothetical protein